MAAARPYNVELEGPLAQLPRRPRGGRAGAPGPRPTSRSSTMCRLDLTAALRGAAVRDPAEHRELRNKESPKKKKGDPAKKGRKRGLQQGQEGRRKRRSLARSGEWSKAKSPQPSTAHASLRLPPSPPGSKPRNPPSPPPRYSFPLLDPLEPAAAPALTSHQTYFDPPESFPTFPHIGSQALESYPAIPPVRRSNAEAPGVPRHGLVFENREGLGAGFKHPMRGSLRRRRIAGPRIGRSRGVSGTGVQAGADGGGGFWPPRRPREGFTA